uniref:AAI domain-containing protein n=1 Tax=Panagrellus redivivus TaxID=6233 RepID=A0A7E4VRG6_PANRE
MHTSARKWHHIAVFLIGLTVLPQYSKCGIDSVAIFVQTYENHFDPELKDVAKCKELINQCLAFRRILGCGRLCKRINNDPVNPCRRFVEPCFGIPLEMYVAMRQFDDNDYESY